jgi:hypothetical protein
LNTIDRRKLTVYRNDNKKIVVEDEKGKQITRRRTFVRTDSGDIKPLNMALTDGSINIENGKRQIQEINITQFSYNP